MKIQSKTVFPIMTVFVTAIMLSIPPAFADHPTASVSTPQGTSVPGCEATNECYIPYQVTVDVGGVVTWSNDDSAAHTVTAGSAVDGPSGEFPYFCMVHPWMEGIVTVQATESPEPGDGTIIVGAPPEDQTTVTGISEDGKLRAEITATNPVADEVMSLEIKFRDDTGAVQKHANYDLVVTQNGNEVLSVMGAHEHEGTGMHSTAPLNSAEQVDIQVTVLGFGLPDDQENWSGPKGEILMFNVVPEFGTIAALILGIAIISVIATSAKSKLSIVPKL